MSLEVLTEKKKHVNMWTYFFSSERTLHAFVARM